MTGRTGSTYWDEGRKATYFQEPDGIFPSGSKLRAQRLAAMELILDLAEDHGFRFYDTVTGLPRFAEFPSGSVAAAQRVASLNAGRILAYSRVSGVDTNTIVEMIHAVGPRIWSADRLCLEAGLAWPEHERQPFQREVWLNRLTAINYFATAYRAMVAFARTLEEADRGHLGYEGVVAAAAAHSPTPQAPERLTSIRDLPPELVGDPIAVAGRVFSIIAESPEVFGLAVVSTLPYEETPTEIPLTLAAGFHVSIPLSAETTWTDLLCARQRREEDPVALFSGITPEARYQILLDQSYIDIDTLRFVLEHALEWRSLLNTRNRLAEREDDHYRTRDRIIQLIDESESMLHTLSHLI